MARGRCAPHAAQHDGRRGEYDLVRGSAAARGYDADWNAAKKAHRAEHPACERCQGTKTLDVHHRVPVRVAPERRLDPTNLVTLCRSCHRKAEGEAR